MAGQITQGDCLEELKKLDAGSFDACFCDPPYGIRFMGNERDHGVPSTDVWCQVLRILKPGAFLLAFGGTRTWHRLAVNIEEAGFDVRDTLMWLHGQGFPKSHDIAKAIDREAGLTLQDGGVRTAVCANTTASLHKTDGFASAREKIYVEKLPTSSAARRWAGYGTALKPAWEPVIVAMKPCDGTFAENALQHGVAGLNIDGCRIPGTVPSVMHSAPTNNLGVMNDDGWHPSQRDFPAHPQGRWPANLILDKESAEILNERGGVQASRFFYCAKASRREREAGLEQMETRKKHTSSGDDHVINEICPHHHITLCECGWRSKPVANFHPTVKPLDLCRYISQLILPPQRERERRLLVPYCGTGSEMIGALLAGWDEVVGIEIEAAYVEVGKRRLEYWGTRIAEICPAAPAVLLKGGNKTLSPPSKKPPTDIPLIQ